jgi:hypothetical protein
MLYQPVAGQWRLFGLAVAAVPGNAASEPKAVAPAPKDAPKKAGDGKKS